MKGERRPPLTEVASPGGVIATLLCSSPMSVPLNETILVFTSSAVSAIHPEPQGLLSAVICW